MTDKALVLRGVTKRFDATDILRGVDLELGAGEFVALVGPSGCGKSTLLRLIAGFDAADSGSIAMAGRAIDRLPPYERDIAMVFQSFALYPHMSVFENLATPLAVRRLSLAGRLPLTRHLAPGARAGWAGIRQDVAEIARMLQIEPLLGRRPGQLSGGQKQRVALGRAIARRPRIFLMDEPLSSLDAALRTELRVELVELQRRLGVSCLYVTHDQTEAMTMADRIAVMLHGRVAQVGTPAEVYGDPQHLAVARFIGTPSINILPAELGSDGRLLILGQAQPLRVAADVGLGVTAAIRPEHLAFRRTASRAAEPGDLLASVRHVEHLGHEAMVQLALASRPDLAVSIRVGQTRLHEALALAPQEQLALRIAPESRLVFDADGRRLPARPVVSQPAATAVAS
jgi:multiple sugar transport system ATP-binding protein